MTIGSDNGPAFVSQIVQSLALALGTKWKLHCKYSPQSSGQVKKINQTLKETLTKLATEAGGDWVTLLPFALFRARNTPYQLNLTPFEILYGRPPPVCPIFKGKKLPPPTLGQFQEALMALSKVHSCVWKLLREIHVGQIKGTIPLHDIGPGDWV